jgi:hypothetical protein
VSWEGRLAWLLRAWRLHQPDSPFHDPAAFARALALHGYPASPDQILAWESGLADPTYGAWIGYEKALGLRHCALVSCREYLRVFLPAGSLPRLRGPDTPDEPLASVHVGQDRERLLDAAVTGLCAPIQWVALSGHLMADPDWVIDEDDAQALADEIVSQLARGVDLAYRLLSVSAANIAAVPAMHGPMVSSIRSYLGDPDVQVVYDPLGLLDQISSPEASDLILDLFERAPNRAMYLHAVWLATQMMVRHNFDDRQRARLGVLVLARWRANPEQAPRDLAQLIAVLPAGFREAFSRAAAQDGNTDFGYVLEHGEDVSAAAAERMAYRIVDAVHELHPGGVDRDRAELESLVREGLFHRESERRHLAAVVLSASPYAHHVGEAALDVLSERDTVALARGRVATLCSYLAGDEHRLRLSPFVGDADETVAAAITLTFGHLSFAATSDQVLRHTIPTFAGSLGRSHMYALGMTASPGLAAIAGSSVAPDWQRRAAAWWLRVGPAIR